MDLDCWTCYLGAIALSLEPQTYLFIRYISLLLFDCEAMFILLILLSLRFRACITGFPKALDSWGFKCAFWQALSASEKGAGPCDWELLARIHPVWKLLDFSRFEDARVGWWKNTMQMLPHSHSSCCNILNSGFIPPRVPSTPFTSTARNPITSTSLSTNSWFHARIEVSTLSNCTSLFATPVSRDLQATPILSHEGHVSLSG